MKQIGHQNDRHRILFDCSAIEAAIGYLRNRTDKNLERLISMQGSRLAYSHYLWSSFGSKLTIGEFWKKNLEQTICSKQLETAIDAAREYLAGRQESRRAR
jgi:hypothetical protein